MGEHRYNPTAIAAKEGGILPNPKKIGAKEMKRILERNAAKYMAERMSENLKEKRERDEAAD